MSAITDKKITKDDYRNILNCPKCNGFIHFKFFEDNCVCKCGYAFTPELRKKARRIFEEYLGKMQKLQIEDRLISYGIR